MTQLKDNRFTGAFTAITTPFSADGSQIDYDRLAQQIAFQAIGGVKGIVVAGTTGESPTLSEGEYKQLITHSVQIGHQNGLVVIAGTGSNNTAHAVELQRFAADAGADAGLSVNPYYNKPTQEGLERHFRAVADASSMPVVLYNVPSRSGVALNPETVARLAGHKNICAIKEATGSTDSASEIGIRCPELAILSGDDSTTLPFASIGAVGVVSVASNIVPDKVAALCDAFNTGQWEEARGLHRTIFGLCRAMFLETNPIPLKAAMKLLDRDTGAVRLPLTPASEQTVAALGQVLRRLELMPQEAEQAVHA